MSSRFPARAHVLAVIVAALALTSACSEGIPTPFDGPGADGTTYDTAFRRDGLPGGSRKNTVASVEISPDGVLVPVGEQLTLTATVRNRTGQRLDRAPLWASSDTTVATVVAGALHAVKTGTALVIAAVDGVSDTTTATVTAAPAVVDSVVVDPGAASLIVDQSLTLTAQAVDSTGTAVANRNVGWATADAAIATITADGVVTGIATGHTVVRATADGNITSVDVTVSPEPPIPVATVTVTPSPASVREGATLQLSAVTADSSGATLPGRTVTWATSNDHVAKVSASGLVTAVAAGTATVTANSEGQTGTSTVQVTPSVVPVASVTMSVTTASLTAGESVQLVAVPKDGSGNTLTGRTITWATSNGAVATVSGSGLVHAVAAGQAAVTATVDGQSGTTAVTVSAPATPPPPTTTTHAGYYVTPTGSSGGTGSMSSPWDLAGVLRGSHPVAPGDTVWVRGGTYRGAFVNYLNGSATRQIIVRAYPGERATIDGNLLVMGSYVTVWGLEVMNSNPAAGSSIGVNVKSPGSRMVNLVIHDASRSGVGLWNEAPDAVLYGSLIYNNGTVANLDHGVYFNGNTGTKYLTDNIVFDNWQYGLHGYSAIEGELTNLRLDGNVVFNNGSIGPYHHGPDIFVGGSTIRNLSVTNSLTWRPDDGELTLRLLGGQNLTLTGNRTVGNTTLGSWTSLDQSGNTFWSSSAPPSSGLLVFVRPNAYEAGRANIVVYNWGGAGSASADVSGVLRSGDTYEVRDAQNFYGAPVLSGTYGGGSLSLPMRAVSPPPVIGRASSTPTSTGTEFHVFVLLRTD